MAKVLVDPEKCDGCGVCVRLCPFSSLKLEGGKAVQASDCYLCGGCEALCEAIELVPLLEPKELRGLEPGGGNPRRGPRGEGGG